jgi:hypothetical protein
MVREGHEKRVNEEISIYISCHLLDFRKFSYVIDSIFSRKDYRIYFNFFVRKNFAWIGNINITYTFFIYRFAI